MSRRRGLAWALAACAIALAGCAGPAAVLAPNPHLHAEGVPPLPPSLVEAVRRYTGIAGHRLLGWHPTRPELLLSHRTPDASTSQLYRLRQPLGEIEPLSAGREPVTRAEWEPREGRFIVLARAEGGDEADQWFRLDPDTRAQTQLTPAGERHGLLGWLNQRQLMIMASVPLDRTAAGGSREALETTLRLIDPLAPEKSQLIARLPGIGWSGAALSPDDQLLALTQVRSSTETHLWLLELGAPGALPVRLLPARDDAPPAVHLAEAFAADGRSLFIRTDRSSEFRELARLDLASGELSRLSAHIPWDIADVALSPDASRLALRVNAGGRGELRWLDATSGTELTPPPLPPGSLAEMRWQPGSAALALQLSSAHGPGQIHVLPPGGAAPVAWTRPVLPPGVDPSGFAEAAPVRWTGFDGLALSGWITRPDPRRHPGPRPVVVLVHGGPASQAGADWLGRYHYLVEELGIAVLQPNVRGSSGFGKTFLALDDGRRREDSVRDLGALLDWIAAQPGLDPHRVVVMGGSYGGYMSLAASVHYAERIAGAVSTVGISNFVSFLERTESYRRDLRRTEYGDERDPAMRAFLERISPLNQVERITKPLLVVQGRNDPRVPWTESEQIVRRLQQRGTPVWYLLAHNEGHGFARRENAEAYFATVVHFLEMTVGR